MAALPAGRRTAGTRHTLQFTGQCLATPPQVTESFFFRKGDVSRAHTLLLGAALFPAASVASRSFLRISRTSAWNTSSM